MAGAGRTPCSLILRGGLILRLGGRTFVVEELEETVGCRLWSTSLRHCARRLRGALRRLRVTRTRLAYPAAWLGLVGAVAAAGAIVSPAGSADASPCFGVGLRSATVPQFQLPGFAGTGKGDQGDEENSLPPVFDELAPGTRIKLRFADSAAAQKQEIYLSVIEGQELPGSDWFNNQERLNARFGDTQTLRGPSGDIGPTGAGIQTRLERRSSRELGLCLRLDPSELHVPPGSYHGSLWVAHETEMLSAIEVEATFRGPWRKAAFFAFLGVFLGLVVKTLSEAAAIARTTGAGSREAVRIYTSRLEFLVLVILAVIAGTFIYVVQYLHDPDWGADGTDTLRLFATCFVVQMGSSEALSVVSRVAGGGPSVPLGSSGGN